MVDKIYALKNMMIQRLEKTINERGIDRIDVQEAGEIVDMIKDLAEAEKACLEAEYYGTVTEAMSNESQGYGQGYSQGYNQGQGYGYNNNQGYGSGGSGYGSGGGASGYRRWGNQYGSGTTRRCYSSGMSGHQDMMEGIRMAMQSANQEDREAMKNELKSMIGM